MRISKRNDQKIYIQQIWTVRIKSCIRFKKIKIKYFDGIFFLNCFKYVKLGRKKHVVKEFDAYKEGGDKMKNYILNPFTREKIK